MWGGIAAGAGSLLGGIGSTAMSNSANRAMQKKQMEWEKEKAKNAHQWQVEDLKKAGINPVLTAGGAGAQTGSISGMQTDTSGLTSAGKAVGEAIQLSLAKEKNEAEVKTLETTADAQTATAEKARAEATKTLNENKYISPKQKAEIAKLEIDNKLNQETMRDKIAQQAGETESTLAKARIDINNAKILQKYGVTREEAIQIGTEGVKILSNLIGSGLSQKAIHKSKKELLQLSKRKKTSAKRINKKDGYEMYTTYE